MGSEKRLYILDTNVLMHDPTALFRFEEHDIFLPMMVLEELDAAKKGLSEVARNVRQVSRFIDEMIDGSDDEVVKFLQGTGLPGILDSRNDVLPAGQLRVQGRGCPQDLTVFKVDNMEDDGGRPEVTGEAADPFPRSARLHVEDRPGVTGPEKDGGHPSVLFADGMGQFLQRRIFAVQFPGRSLFAELPLKTPKVAFIILQRGRGDIHLHFFYGRIDLVRSGNVVFMLFQEAGGDDRPNGNLLELGEADGQIVLDPGQTG